MKYCKINAEYLALLVFIIFCPIIVYSSDYYELLGVKKDADSKEIRKAFKKLALTMHPDKNQGDEAAHDRFIKINKAYEVLKDQETRKKYDTYGEEGLKDDFGSGWKGNFHSWNYYYESFGIYDDDPEVTTLTKSDFERIVEGSETIWFINFYSPQCSHCHTLAPVWRQLARDLENVIRIGAINCEEDWHICRQLNIRSYPTLMLFPQELKYHSQRDLESLTEFVLGEIGDPYYKLTKDNFANSLDQVLNVELPWLIYFCGQNSKNKKSTDCWDLDEVKKLAIMVDGLVNVGYVECHQESKLCDSLSFSPNKWLLYDELKSNGENKDKTVIEGEERKEIFDNLLKRMPEPELLNQNDFEQLRLRLKTSNNDEGDGDGENPHLIYFHSKTNSLDKEVKILQTLIGYVRLNRVDCDENEHTCSSLYLDKKKLPIFVIFRQGGSYEIFHGEKTVHDISLFVKETLESQVETLEPRDFPGRVVHSDKAFFVDFFAPWCPPCMNLLPEFRKSSKIAAHLANFGTVDCTVHSGLCSSYSIKSYPTTILFNNTIPHQFHGRHSSNELVEFVEDTLNPLVINLTPSLFATLIENKESDVIIAVDFFAPWCGPCNKLSPHWRRMAKALVKETTIKVAQVDCQAHQDICRGNGVSSYPTLRVYPLGSTNNRDFRTFNGWSRDSESLKVWVRSFLPTVAKSLSSNEFLNQVLVDESSWLIDFYAPWCGHCTMFEPVFEEIAKELEGKVKAGKIDCDKHVSACQQASVRAYPTLRLYSGSKDGTTQNPWGEDIDSQDAQYILHYVNKKIPRQRRVDNLKDEL